MDPILAEIYSTVLPVAPYVLAAFVGIWAALFIYLLVINHRAKRTSADLAALHEALAAREEKAGE